MVDLISSDIDESMFDGFWGDCTDWKKSLNWKHKWTSELRKLVFINNVDSHH